MRCKVLQPGAHDRSINDLLEFQNCNAAKSCVTRQPLIWVTLKIYIYIYFFFQIYFLQLISEASEFFKFLFFNLFLQQTSVVVEFAYPL